MARFDAFIEVMFREAATALMFETGQAAWIEVAAGQKPLMQRPLNSQQIVGAASELLPAHEREAFKGDAPFDVEYAAPAGKVRVRFRTLDEGVRVMVEPLRSAASREHPGFHGVALARMAPAAVAKPEPTRRGIEVEPPPLDASAAMLQLLGYMVAHKASDLHLTSKYVPCLRVDGDVTSLQGYGEISPERMKEMLFSIAPQQNRDQFNETKDTDFAYETEQSRFRVNMFADRSGVGAVLRRIPNTIMSAEEMGLSKHLLDLCFLHKGLVLVTGPTGSGKSTTLAALIDYINKNRDDHIITIEDPIEFVHPHKRCLVHQREVGVHTAGFKPALRAALREDPDIVLVGELRDLETISIALETAETGHLVFGTLHTNTAPSTVDRIIDQFPADRQPQIRTMLSESLKAVVTQTLCKKVGGGRAAAQEILLVNSAVSNLIREGKTFQIQSVMQTGRGSGMQTLNDALMELVKKKTVKPAEALSKSVQKSEMKAMLDKLEQQFKVVEQNAVA